jgi:hypothetical protein
MQAFTYRVSTVLRRTWKAHAMSGKLPRFRCGFPLPEISGNVPHLDDYMREQRLTEDKKLQKGQLPKQRKCCRSCTK